MAGGAFLEVKTRCRRHYSIRTNTNLQNQRDLVYVTWRYRQLVRVRISEKAPQKPRKEKFFSFRLYGFRKPRKEKNSSFRLYGWRGFSGGDNKMPSTLQHTHKYELAKLTWFSILNFARLVESGARIQIAAISKKIRPNCSTVIQRRRIWNLGSQLVRTFRSSGLR